MKVSMNLSFTSDVKSFSWIFSYYLKNRCISRMLQTSSKKNLSRHKISQVSIYVSKKSCVPIWFLFSFFCCRPDIWSSLKGCSDSCFRFLFFSHLLLSSFLALKAWHKKFFVLRESPSGPELSMYSSQQEVKAGILPPSFTIFVRETVHLGITSESHRFSHVLVVVVSGKSPLLLAAEDELTARYVWIPFNLY